MLSFLYKIGDYSYRRLVTLVTVLYTLFLILLAILGFLLSQIVIPILIAGWLIFVAITLYSKRKSEATVKWSLRTMWQQFKDWRYGRRTRSRLRDKQEYEGHFHMPNK